MYKDSYYKNKTVVRSSYLYYGNTNTSKVVSFYWYGLCTPQPTCVSDYNLVTCPYGIVKLELIPKWTFTIMQIVLSYIKFNKKYH